MRASLSHYLVPLCLLVFGTSLSSTLVYGKEDRVPTCEELIAGYDDDSVACMNDSSYDLSALDPQQAPMRCREWDPKDVDLDVLDPLFICVKWFELYGIQPTQPPTKAPTLAPTEFPTKSPTSPPENIDKGEDSPTNDTSDSLSSSTQSIQVNDFSLRIIVPTNIQRKRMLRSGAVPYDQLELARIVNDHVYQYLEDELSRNVASVNLRVTSSQVTSLQTSTVVKEVMSGTVDFNVTQTVVPSRRTVNALVIQALEGQALWEFFFRLRGASDPFLAKTQQVTLVESNGSSNTGTGNTTFSTGVIVTLVVIGVVTASIVGYFVYWLKKQQQLEQSQEKEKKSPETPETQTSTEGQYFSDTPPETKHNRSFRKHQHKSQDEVSVGNLSFVSSVNSALHSIRERSLEDEEDDDIEDEPRMEESRSQSRLWDDDTASEIDFQTELVENLPYSKSSNDDVTVVEDYGQIGRIMPLETTYSTNTATEVTRREVPLSQQKPKEKPANRWVMWKSRHQKKNAAAKQRRVVPQKKALAETKVPPPPVDTSLDPPSMVDMSLDPPSQVDMSVLETSLDPPSRMELEEPSFQSDTSLDGESIQLSFD